MSSPPRSQPEIRARRQTIAVALDHPSFYGGGLEAELRERIHQECQQLDLNLLLVYGRGFEEPHSAAHNAIFELLQPDRVDGLIVASATLAGFCGEAGMKRFVERYGAVPLCSVGIALPQVPSVVLDNRPAMAALLQHVIRDHGCRRMAFIAGAQASPDAKVRLEVYQEVLQNHGIPYDPALIQSGDFVKLGGSAAMTEILARGVDFDAVVAANDAMAIGAIDALREHGYHVPGDLPVTGFDDLMLARVYNPALTTVSQPFPAIAQTALHVVLEQLAGRRVPDRIELPCKLIIRRSCGCNPPLHGTQSVPAAAALLSPSAHLRERAAELRGILANCLRRTQDDGAREADQLLDALQRALYGRPKTFHRVLEGMLELAGRDNERYRALQNAVTLLRQDFRDVTTVELETLWGDAFCLIALANTTAQVEHRLKLDESYQKLLATGKRASVAFDLASLRRELHKSLPAAGFPTVCLSRHPQADTRTLVPFVCLRDGKPQQLPPDRFPAQRLFSDAAYAPERRHSAMVFPLVFEAQPLGVAVFEYNSGTEGCHLVRDQISTAIRTATLHQQVVVKTTLHERSVQERLATAQRMQALSLLAGGVAHDLNNALGPLVALPDIILQELAGYETLKGSVPPVSEDIESIKAAAMRASRTIKDLLTLGRQGRTKRRPRDLKQIVKTCLDTDSLRALRQVNPNVQVVVELPEEQLVIRASEAQLTRAITNLARNAVEAISGSGKVLIRLTASRVETPSKSGYEAVSPGDYAVLTVADSGVGIPGTELDRVFEPFFSSKAVGEQSGTGLGLAIVHGVVKEHEGFVDVASAPGSGTQFTLYFPRASEAPRRTSSELIEAAPTGDARILIVDDEPVQLRTGRRVLSHLGYAVDTLDSGQSAYQLFLQAAPSGKSPYDLIILDMLLNEERDGLQIFEQIQHLFPEQRAIVASGHAPTERAEQAVAQGLAWLAKPYTPVTLACAVRDALQSPSATLSGDPAVAAKA